MITLVVYVLFFVLPVDPPRVRRSYRWREGAREPAEDATQTEPSPALAR